MIIAMPSLLLCLTALEADLFHQLPSRPNREGPVARVARLARSGLSNVLIQSQNDAGNRNERPIINKLIEGDAKRRR
jgi:hypothetical protein